MNLYKKQIEHEKRYKQMMDNTFDQKLADEYCRILSAVDDGDKTVDENTMQDFLEMHTPFIPTPFMQNHGLHFNSFISKFPVGPWFTDFAYLTKSTVEWYLVLMEIESPHKKLQELGACHFEKTVNNRSETLT